jgi:glycosyltransferase involved in cell wall biosynthesis
MSAPFFSVVIPVYNRAGLLGRALHSVRAQDFTDFEIVVVDDGSSDNPKAVIDALADARIRYLRQDNKGGGAARNAGIDAARGRHVAFLDSDDEFLPGHLARLKALLEAPNTAAFARIVVDRGNGRRMIKPPRAPHAGEHIAAYLMADRGFVPTITLAVPTEIARRIRYHENLRAAEDTDFAIRLHLAGVRFQMEEEPGAVWHDRYDPNRQSLGRTGTNLEAWLETLRPQIPKRAWRGYRGWAIAKVVARTNPLRALALYLTAAFTGAYRARLAAVVFLQIFLPDGLYRRMADRAIATIAFTGRKPSGPSFTADEVHT